MTCCLTNTLGGGTSLLVVLHVAVTYLVYRLCIRLTRDTWSAAAGALVFGLHPIHVETIAESAWADQPLSTFFMLAAILAFCRSRESMRNFRWMAASLGFTAAALLSKESGLMLPLLVSGYVWIFERAGRKEAGMVEPQLGILARLRSALLAGVPFWTVLLLYVPLRIRALKGFSSRGHAALAIEGDFDASLDIAFLPAPVDLAHRIELLL